MCYVTGGILTGPAENKKCIHTPGYLLLICHHLHLGGREESNYVTKDMFYPLWE